MNINSPVKMLPQEVKTPLVPESEMCTESSTMGFAEDNRKAGPDAFADPDAQKRAISDASTGLPKCSIQEDKSPLEGSSASAGLSKDDKDVLQKLEDCLERVEESGNSSDDEDNMFVYDTTFCGDLTGLENAVDAFYESGSKLHTKCFDVFARIGRPRPQLHRGRFFFNHKFSGTVGFRPRFHIYKGVSVRFKRGKLWARTMLIEAQFCSDSFSSICLDAVKDGRDFISLI